METKVAIIKDIKKDIKFIEEAAQVIRNGGTVAFPTETVYGLGANALNDDSVKKIFIAKGRPQDNPLIVHVSSKDVSTLVKEVPPIAQELINRFWPGPLTIILEKKDIIPNVTSANLNTIGIRMPNSEIALKLIELSERPIAAPSAITQVLSVSAFSCSSIANIFVFPPALSHTIFFSFDIALKYSYPEFVSSTIILSGLHERS